MTSAVRTEGHLAAPSDSDRKNYQRLFRATFLFFLTLALVGRLLPGGRRQGSAEEGEPESLIDEARRMSNTILPFVFIR
jgi:hypothetical protein